MRYVVLDTETTGLEVREGHRIIEIGCVELAGRQLTGRHYHQYIKPERAVDQGAYEVHGISNEMLEDKPVFAQIANDFLDFIQGSTLIIHNASFDLGFLNAELERIGKGCIDDYVGGETIDTLKRAREMFPGKRNNLDALCDRLGVNNSHRQLHGALLDSEILGEVFLAMTRGQDSLTIGSAEGADVKAGPAIKLAELNLPMAVLDPSELETHQKYLEGIEKESKSTSIWNQLVQTQ